MKIKDLSKKLLWFVLGAAFVSFLSFVSTSDAQQSKFVKLIMRFGEERILEDGTKVGVSKGEGDLIVVTLSKPISLSSSTSSTLSSSTSTKLKLGTYDFRGTELTTVKSLMSTSEYSSRMKINIQSIDGEGNVRAELTRSGNKTQLRGKIDANGNLQLEGYYFDSNKIRWNFTLKAIAQDNKMIDVRYLIDSSYVEVKGKNDIVEWEEDF